MAVDTPATIAILGAGPMGLETALYARFLGYDVKLYERGTIGENVLRWGHVRMLTPFSLNCSRLGLAALAAQDDKYRPPDPGAALLGREWVRQYLLPLAQTDLLVDHLREHVTVVSVARQDLLKEDLPDLPDRGDSPFRILIRDQAGSECSEKADIVIDTTGVYGNPNWLGPGGGPAIGEAALRDRIEYGLPDIEGRERDRYAGRHTLLIGDGSSAATNAVALCGLALQAPGTRLTWVTARPPAEIDPGPIRHVASDPLPSRRELASAANRYARGEGSVIEYWPVTVVEAVAHDAERDQFAVRCSGQHAGEQRFDRIVASVGYRGDDSLYAELQVQSCYVTGAPRRLAVAWRDLATAGGLRPACPPQALLNPEPNFYILGAKSYGRDSSFLFATGLDQIRGSFSMIGDRPDLDLYATVKLS
jgi:hypothetical protein